MKKTICLLHITVLKKLQNIKINHSHVSKYTLCTYTSSNVQQAALYISDKLRSTTRLLQLIETTKHLSKNIHKTVHQ